MVVFDAGGEELIWFKGGGYKGVGWRSRDAILPLLNHFNIS